MRVGVPTQKTRANDISAGRKDAQAEGWARSSYEKIRQSSKILSLVYTHASEPGHRLESQLSALQSCEETTTYRSTWDKI